MEKSDSSHSVNGSEINENPLRLESEDVPSIIREGTWTTKSKFNKFRFDSQHEMLRDSCENAIN